MRIRTKLAVATLSLLTTCELGFVSAQESRYGDRSRDGERSSRYGSYGDRDRSRDGDRRDGDRRDGDGDRRRSFDPSEMLRRMDDNKNNLIEPSELSSRSRSFIERAAVKAQLDINQPMSIDRLAAAFKQMQSESGSGGSSSGSSSTSSSGSYSSSSAKPAPPTGPQAFGAPSTLAPAAGFDVPLSVNASLPADKRYDPRVIEYVANMLKEQDKNNDSYIDSNEWKVGRWSTPPESSDTNRDNRLSREELYVRMTRRFNLPLPGEKSVNSSTASSSSGSNSSSSSGGNSDLEKFRGYAKGLLAQHDRNKNGNLERDEWEGLRSDQREADTNRDGVITLDEMTAKLASYSRGGSSSGGSYGSSRYGNSGYSASDKSSTPRKTYRFLSPSERLPKGLPDWFLRNDADGDGQILMTEYTTIWTEAAAADFMQKDLNGDGFITADECLRSGRN